MKSLLLSTILLWTILAMELAWPSLLPQGCLLFPAIGAVLFWSRQPGAVLLTGVALLADWLARPTEFPLTGMMGPLLAAAVLTGNRGSRDDYRQGNLLQRLPQPLHLPLLVLLLLVLHQTSAMTWTEGLAGVRESGMRLPGLLRPGVCIALPVSAVLSLLIRVADELGLRRPLQRVTI